MITQQWIEKLYENSAAKNKMNQVINNHKKKRFRTLFKNNQEQFNIKFKNYMKTLVEIQIWLG